MSALSEPDYALAAPASSSTNRGMRPHGPGVEAASSTATIGCPPARHISPPLSCRIGKPPPRACGSAACPRQKWRALLARIAPPTARRSAFAQQRPSRESASRAVDCASRAPLLWPTSTFGVRGLLMALPECAGEVEQRFSNAKSMLMLPLRAIHTQLVRQAWRGRQPTVSALCCSSSWPEPALLPRLPPAGGNCASPL